MKPCINKLLISAVCAALLLSACSDSQSPQPQPAAPAQPGPTVQQPAPAAPQAEPKEEPTQPPAAPKPQPAPVPEMTAQELTENLKKWDKKLALLETDFIQHTSYDGVEVSRSKGKLFYDRDQNRLRLDTLSPSGDLEQTAITDKKDIVILDENNQHITTLSWADWQQGQPNQALFDFGNYTGLVDKHSAKLEKQDAQTALLVLTPKEGEEYTLYLTLSKQDFFPQTIAVHSELMVTRANLTNTRKNQPLPTAIFGGFNQ